MIQNKTVLIIAHRMRTIADANKVVLLKDGIVSEEGDPKILAQTDSIFRHMTQVQMVSVDWKMS